MTVMTAPIAMVTPGPVTPVMSPMATTMVPAEVTTAAVSEVTAAEVTASEMMTAAAMAAHVMAVMTTAVVSAMRPGFGRQWHRQRGDQRRREN